MRLQRQECDFIGQCVDPLEHLPLVVGGWGQCDPPILADREHILAALETDTAQTTIDDDERRGRIQLPPEAGPWWKLPELGRGIERITPRGVVANGVASRETVDALQAVIVAAGYGR